MAVEVKVDGTPQSPILLSFCPVYEDVKLNVVCGRVEKEGSGGCGLDAAGEVIEETMGEAKLEPGGDGKTELGGAAGTSAGPPATGGGEGLGDGRAAGADGVL